MNGREDVREMILELLNASTPTFDLEFMKPVATEMERKIGEERQKAGGSLGALVGTLQWDNALNNTDLRCDLDFYCVCPNGDRIGYRYQREAGGGHWDRKHGKNSTTSRKGNFS